MTDKQRIKALEHELSESSELIEELHREIDMLRDKDENPHYEDAAIQTARATDECIYADDESLKQSAWDALNNGEDIFFD